MDLLTITQKLVKKLVNIWNNNQNSNPKLKVEIQFYVDSENFMKKY